MWWCPSQPFDRLAQRPMWQQQLWRSRYETIVSFVFVVQLVGLMAVYFVHPKTCHTLFYAGHHDLRPTPTQPSVQSVSLCVPVVTASSRWTWYLCYTVVSAICGTVLYLALTWAILQQQGAYPRVAAEHALVTSGADPRVAAENALVTSGADPSVAAEHALATSGADPSVAAEHALAMNAADPRAAAEHALAMMVVGWMSSLSIESLILLCDAAVIYLKERARP